MTAAPARFDPFAALRALQAHQVRFVVIGGVAGRLWGSPTMTNDLDVCYARDPQPHPARRRPHRARGDAAGG